MGGIITSLQPQRRSADRVNVYLDGEFALGISASEAARLQVGQELSDEEIEQLGRIDEVEKLLDRAIRLLGFRPRSDSEIRQRLRSTGASEEDIEAVCQELSRRGYLDDAAFARFWVQDRSLFRPKAARVLRQELRTRGVADECIEDAVSSLDPLEDAYRALEPWARRHLSLASVDPPAYRAKLSAFLLRRGFEFDTVRATVNRFLMENAETQQDQETGAP